MERVMETGSTNVIVTGSSGFIGEAICRRLVKQGYNVIAFDRPGPPYPPPETEVVDCDIASAESITQAFTRVLKRHGPNLASFIHLAAYYDFSGEPSPMYERINVLGTQRVLNALREFRCEQFVYSSTMLVHAPGEPGLFINEDWPLKPKWDYPRSKVDAERIILADRGDTNAVVLRISGVYDDMCRSIPLAHHIDRIYRKQLIARVYPGSTAHGQSFMHNDDLTDVFDTCVKYRRALPEESIMLIGERFPLCYDELQHTFARLLHGESWETRVIPKPLAKTGAWLENAVPGEEPFIKPWMIDLADDHYALDLSRAYKWLDWEPKKNLRDTIPVMIENLKQDPPVWFAENDLEIPEAVGGS
jgi:nucleoside-diphosphate-sugar epimerase